MTKRFGFTLAEVLITLGIIGVVAAMTMPTLINQTNGAQYKAAYKKALSAISQGITLNVALDDYDLKDLSGNDSGNGTLLSLFKKRMNVVNSYDKATVPNYSYTNGVGTAGQTVPATNTTVFFNDGSMFSFVATTAGCTKNASGAIVDAAGTSSANCTGFIDVNGLKGPNKMVKCDSGTKDADCVVNSPTDIYPVIFYDQTIQPNSSAARAVLFGKQ